MNRFRWAVLVVLLVFPAVPSQLVGQACEPSRTALVLSGGGVKGLAHIGVLRVLDSLGVVPDLIVGTSMGSIIGALYASGYSGKRLDALVRTLDLERIFQSYDLHGPQRLRTLSPLVIWEKGAGGLEVQNASVSEAAVNFLLDAGMLRGNLVARGDFDSLTIPFRSVATNLANGAAETFDSGDLAQVVRASMAVPVVFEPVEINGQYYIDGGLSQNVPAQAARDAGATRLIISDVTSGTPDSLNPYSVVAVGEQLINYLFTQDLDTLPGDIYLRTDLKQYRTLDLDRRTVVGVLDAGYRVAQSSLPSARCLPRSPMPAPPTLPSVVGHVMVDSLPIDEQINVLDLLGLEDWAPLDTLMLRRQFGVLSETQWYRSIWLHPGGSGDTVSFMPAVRRAPRWVAGLAVAYNNDRGGKLWLGLVNRRLFSSGLEGTGFLFLGRFRQELFLGLRNTKRLGSYLVTPGIAASGAFEDVRRFDGDGKELPSIHVEELVGVLGVERRYFGRWSVALGLEGRAWTESDSSQTAAGGQLNVMKTGKSAAPRAALAVAVTGVYQRAELLVAPVIPVARWEIRPYLRLGWGASLPAQLQFPLGGMTGFPGLHIGERLGDREVDLGMTARYHLGRLLFVSGEVAVGRAAFGGGLLGSDDWLVGARVGIGAETPFGPVGIDYGVTENRRNLLLFRFGRWF